MKPKIVITGVTGTVGSVLAEKFHKLGYSIVGISRNVPVITFGKHLKVDLAQVDVSELPYFPGAVVINCAAITRDGWDPKLEKDMLSITNAALRLSDGPFVHLSSSSVYNLLKPSINVSEEDATGNYKFLNSYSVSKWRNEVQVIEKGKSQVVVLRPHAIYGVNDNTLIPRLNKSVKFNCLILPGGGNVLHSVTNVQNLADSVLSSVEKMLSGALQGNHIFNITDRYPVLLHNAIKSVLPSYTRILSIHPNTAYWLARRCTKLVPSGHEPWISEYIVSQVSHERSYDISKAIEFLNYSPTETRLFSLLPSVDSNHD